MKVLSLDMASQKTGYALYNDSHLIDYGLWDLSQTKEKDWRKRIATMAQHISDFCDEQHIDMIVVEDVPPITQNSQTVKVLSALQGMLISLGIAHKIEVKFVSVTTWKSKLNLQLDKSSEGRAMTKRVKVNHPKQYDKFHSWVKGWGKKISVDYANHTFGLDLIYKSPSSKSNQDDIADAINIGWSVMGENVEPYNLEDFQSIMEHLYNSLTPSE